MKLVTEDPQLTWEKLEELITQVFADKGKAIEAMRALLKLSQQKDETPGELGTRLEKLVSLAFPEDVRNNSAMQAQLADSYAEALGDKRIHHNVLKEVPVKLQAAVTPARKNQGVWEKTKKVSTKEKSGSRQAVGR